jgi:hypothetical protein
MRRYKLLAELTDDRQVFVWRRRNGSVVYRVVWDYDAGWTTTGGRAGVSFGNLEALQVYLGSESAKLA